MSTSHNPLFPIFLKANQLNILIVGAGNVGAEKLFFLLKSSPDAKVTVVSDEISEEVKTIAAEYPQVNIYQKSFHADDLLSVDIVIAATNNRATNVAIRSTAKEKGILVNVADTPDLCDFYLGGIVTKGDLKIAISTNGQSPTFAKRFRQVLEETLPDSIPEMLVNLRAIRDQLKGDFGSKVKKLNELTAVLTDKL
ncbi:MAG: bifunctional precorrin-2 dehydrogenase/sirohydrochlorin ferrochelatase [Bacteroidetes bacterium]|nr:bifunctional precorrin-2 dehydrogenase/sirohydrochlorin ferrochelatase [Bacteroidota bacterium]